jgi:hypothetical protein
VDDDLFGYSDPD